MSQVPGCGRAAWSTSAAGTYTATAVFAEPISGVGEWTITIMNSWASSNGASYDTDITFIGLCEGLPEFPPRSRAAWIRQRAITPAVLDATVDDGIVRIDDGSCDLTSCYG